jgi:Zn finger protein HypA/HybF involved in hydrogenase expression
MKLKEAIAIVKEFMGSYTGNHGEAIRTLVAAIENNKLVISKKTVLEGICVDCKEKVEVKNNDICPKCGSDHIRLTSTNYLICHKCAHMWDI